MQMRCSNDNSAWSGWEPYATSKVWELTAGDGPKQVYAQFRDASGNLAPTVIAAIVLDTVPPTNGSLTAAPGTGQVNLSWSGFADSGSGIDKYVLRYSTTGYPTPATGTLIYQGPATSFTHTTLGPGNNHYYRVCAVDKAGNISTGSTAYAKLSGKAVMPPLLLLLE
jgi:predicted phage tail protein